MSFNAGFYPLGLGSTRSYRTYPVQSHCTITLYNHTSTTFGTLPCISRKNKTREIETFSILYKISGVLLRMYKYCMQSEKVVLIN